LIHKRDKRVLFANEISILEEPGLDDGDLKHASFVKRVLGLISKWFWNAFVSVAFLWDWSWWLIPDELCLESDRSSFLFAFELGVEQNVLMEDFLLVRDQVSIEEILVPAEEVVGGSIAVIGLNAEGITFSDFVYYFSHREFLIPGDGFATFFDY
jgi:hypothetical protein